MEGLLDGADVATCRVLLFGPSAACRESDVMHDVILGMIVVRQVDTPAGYVCLFFNAPSNYICLINYLKKELCLEKNYRN